MIISLENDFFGLSESGRCTQVLLYVILGNSYCYSTESCINSHHISFDDGILFDGTYAMASFIL